VILKTFYFTGFGERDPKENTFTFYFILKIDLLCKMTSDNKELCLRQGGPHFFLLINNDLRIM
jgi:hypothetical protein